MKDIVKATASEKMFATVEQIRLVSFKGARTISDYQLYKRIQTEPVYLYSMDHLDPIGNEKW